MVVYSRKTDCEYCLVSFCLCTCLHTCCWCPLKCCHAFRAAKITTQGSENKVVPENSKPFSPSSLLSHRGGDWCCDGGPLSLQPLPSALAVWPVCPPAEEGRGEASSSAPPQWDPAATQLRRALPRLAAALVFFQQAVARWRRLVALPPLIPQLVVILVVVFLVAVPSPLVPELDGNWGRGGAKADAQRDGAAAAQRAEKLLHASAGQRARAVAQRQSVQGGDPEEGAGLHLRPGGRGAQTAVQEGQT